MICVLCGCGPACGRVGSPYRVAFVPFPARAPMFVIGAAGTLVSLILPEQIEAGHVDFARQFAAKAWAYAVAVERRYRGLPPLPDVPVPYTLTAQAEALLDAATGRADLVSPTSGSGRIRARSRARIRSPVRNARF